MIENIRDISSYFNVRKKVRKAYEQVIDESPRDLNGLSEKYSFNPKDKINVHGCFSNLYSVEKGKVGKVIYKERNGSFFHGMVDSLEKSFDVTMYEFNKLKLASFLDVPVSETYEVERRTSLHACYERFRTSDFRGILSGGLQRGLQISYFFLGRCKI